MIYVLYHAQCCDGFGAAFAAWKYLSNSAKYIPVGYGQKLPDMEPGSTVYMLDIAFSPETTMQLSIDHKQVIVLDHHKTAYENFIKDQGRFSQGINDERNYRFNGDHCLINIDMDRSGAGVAWDYFHTCADNPNRPKLINLIEDRDLWLFKYPETVNLHSYLLSIPFDFGLYNDLLNNTVLELKCVEGAALSRMTDQIVDKICKNARVDDNFLGHKAVVVNATSHWSEVGMKLLDLYPDVDFSCSYSDIRNEVRMFSLRSKKNFDVSKVAEQFGGGGHAQASGFKAKLKVPFENIEYEKIEHK